MIKKTTPFFLALALASCSASNQEKIDVAISKIAASLHQYCVALSAVSAIANETMDKKLVRKIDAGIVAYCNNPVDVKDVPSAIVNLAIIYRAVDNAGIKISLASD